jgi:hypothetical protein
MHTVVRVSEQVGKEPSTEERLRFVEDELTKMRRALAEMTETLGKLVERSAGWSRGGPHTAVIDSGSVQSEAESGTKEDAWVSCVWRTGLWRGRFYAVENSMRGTMEMSNSKFTGNFMCSSGIWNFFVRFYPTPSVINPRKRLGWEFATTSVLGRLRQLAWSSKKIDKMLTDGRRFFEGMLDLDKGEELLALFHGPFEEDAQFYAF